MRLLCILVTICVFTAVQAASADDLKIGTTLSLTGPYATYGRQALHGIEMAIEEVNSTGGVNGKQVKLFVEDFGTLDLKRAVSGARKLIEVDKVDVFLPLIVEDSEVIVPMTTKKPLFTLTVGCGSRKCAFNLGPYHVRAPASHDLIIEQLVEYTKTQNIKHACIIAAESTYFEEYGRYIEELAKDSNQKVTYSSVPLSTSEDYRVVATRFKQAKCDAIYTWIPMGSVGSFFKRVRESGSKALVLGIVETDDPGVLKAAGAAAEGVVFARFSVGSDEFQKRFENKFKEPILRPAIPSYDGVKLLLELIEKVGTDPKALREAFLKVQGRKAVNGTLGFTDEGERIGEIVHLMKIENGVPVEVNS